MTSSQFSALEAWTLTKTVPSNIRENNIMAVFDLLFPSTRIARSEIGRQLGLSRMAITDVTGEMLRDHILREVGEESRTGRGKRSIMLSIDTAYWRVIVLDLSQPYVIKGAVVDLCGRIVDHAEITIDDPDHVSFDQVRTLCHHLIDMAATNVLGIGVAVPGVVDREGNVIQAVHLGWEDMPVSSLLKEECNLPTIVSNATNTALVAERYFGDGSANSMLIRIGPGVGASLCANGMIVEGQNFTAGEIGHIVIDPHGPECLCGKHGCLEVYLSTTSLYAQIAAEPQRRHIILARSGQLLARVLAISVGLVNPHDIALDAPPDIVSDIFLQAMRDELNDAMNTQYMTTPLLHRCQVGADASLRGQAIEVIRTLVPDIRNRESSLSA